MNLTPSFVRRYVALLLLAAAPFASAQVSLNSQLPLPPKTPPPPEGLLGQNYVLADFAGVEQRNGSGRTYGVNLGANFAATENADATINLVYAHQSQWPDAGSLYQLGVDWTFHLNIGRVKPFAVAGLGYQLSRTPSGRDFSLWDLGGGVEVIVAPRTAVTLKAVNVGSFTKGISNPWQLTGGVSYWLQPRVALAASVTFVEDQAVGYTLGVRWGF
jgi:hypothetical protein